MTSWSIDFDDVSNGFKPTIPEEDADYINDLIEEAEVELGVVLGDVAKWVGEDEVRGKRVRVVLKRMVRRVLRNPSGYLSETEGDYSYTRLAQEGLLGDVAVTVKDRRTLGVRRRYSIGTIHVGLPASSPRNQSAGPHR